MKKMAIVLAIIAVIGVCFSGCMKSGDGDMESTTEADPMETYVYEDYVTVYAIDSEGVVAGQYKWTNDPLSTILGSYATYADGVLKVDGRVADTAAGESWNVYVNGKKVDSDITKLMVAGGDLVQFKLEGGKAAVEEST